MPTCAGRRGSVRSVIGCRGSSKLAADCPECAGPSRAPTPCSVCAARGRQDALMKNLRQPVSQPGGLALFGALRCSRRFTGSDARVTLGDDAGSVFQVPGRTDRRRGAALFRRRGAGAAHATYRLMLFCRRGIDALPLRQQVRVTVALCAERRADRREVARAHADGRRAPGTARRDVVALVILDMVLCRV
jgi:hypothetical protein